jgi:hypothetical protein
LDDYFGMVVNTSQKTPEFKYERSINKSKTVIESVQIETEDEWFMLGYFVGDGWIEEGTKQDGRLKHTIRFSVNNKDEEYVGGRIRNVLPITDKKVDTGKCKKFGCSSIKWYNILKEFGKYAHGKRIPEWVQDAPKEMIQEFINGYMAADGTIHKNGSHRISTVSYDLAFGLQRLYLKLGYIFGINKTIRPNTTVIEGRVVNQRDTSQNIQSHFDKNDIPSLQRDCHSMLGIASNLGMTQLSSLALAIENNIRKQELELIPDNIKSLQDKLNQILSDLENYFKTSQIEY